MVDSGNEAARDETLSVVLTTLPNPAAAEVLVRNLVEERLIACGNIVPGVISIYRWNGDVTRDGEVLVVMKTRGALVGKLLARVPELHPYSVPELVELPIDTVAAAYGRWVTESTRAGE